VKIKIKSFAKVSAKTEKDKIGLRDTVLLGTENERIVEKHFESYNP